MIITDPDTDPIFQRIIDPDPAKGFGSEQIEIRNTEKLYSYFYKCRVIFFFSKLSQYATLSSEERLRILEVGHFLLENCCREENITLRLRIYEDGRCIFVVPVSSKLVLVISNTAL